MSPACARCYAETLAKNRMGLSVWGVDAPRRITADATWRKSLRWARLAREGMLPDGSENRDGHRPRIFCASMSDAFEERPDLDAPRRRLFDLIEQTPDLDWLLLTKRPEFARSWLDAYYSEHYFRGIDIPLANVWMGVSIENARFTWRADVLREIPAAVRFISAEPLLGSLMQDHVKSPTGGVAPTDRGTDGRAERGTASGAHRRAPLDLDGIDWVIVGGESGGRKTRPMRVEWAREIRDAVLDQATCLGESRPAFHFKQWGSHDEDGVYRGAAPKSGGKLLDAVDWCEFPRAKVLA